MNDEYFQVISLAFNNMKSIFNKAPGFSWVHSKSTHFARLAGGLLLLGTIYSLIQYKGYNSKFKFLTVYSLENILFLYLHFTWLYGSWNHQRILKKHTFWKYDNWFSSDVSKPTLVKYPWNQAWQKLIFTNIAP